MSHKWIWFPKRNVPDFQNDAEVKLYPDLYEKYVPQSQLAEKDKEIAELRAALEFYADPETYIESEDSDPETGYFDPASHFDIKSVAIQALQNTKKEG